jgi:hypothetical protein
MLRCSIIAFSSPIFFILVILYIIYHKIREGHLIWLGEA